MIAFIVGFLAGGFVGLCVMACFARSGRQAECEDCEYRNWYLRHTCNTADK